MGVKPLSLAVFISGRGSNLQSLIDACAQADFPARIAVVVSNRPDAYGLERAKHAGISTEIIDHKSFSSREDFEKVLLDRIIQSYDIDVICLAGFMRILSASFIDGFKSSKSGRDIINIHPSLLPAYKGLDTHARAIADGAAQAGCSVHYVTQDLDSGAIILQKSVPVLKDDTANTLAARVLELEHIAYPEAIQIIAHDRM